MCTHDVQLSTSQLERPPGILAGGHGHFLLLALVPSDDVLFLVALQFPGFGLEAVDAEVERAILAVVDLLRKTNERREQRQTMGGTERTMATWR